MSKSYSGYKPTKAEAKREAIERLMAAEEVCWALLILIGIGELELPEDSRKFLGESLQKWNDLAVTTGILPNK